MLQQCITRPVDSSSNAADHSGDLMDLLYCSCLTWHNAWQRSLHKAHAVLGKAKKTADALDPYISLAQLQAVQGSCMQQRFTPVEAGCGIALGLHNLTCNRVLTGDCLGGRPLTATASVSPDASVRHQAGSSSSCRT